MSIDVSALADMREDCSCGRTHIVPIKRILTGRGALSGLAGILGDFEGAKVFLVGDRNTMPLAEEPVRGMLRAARCDVVSHTFESAAHLILDKKLIGAMLIRMPSDTGLIVAVGSGTLNDLSRVIGARCKIPYVIVGTAPSMDGYASTVSPVVMEGGKLSVPLGVPYAVVADTDLLRTAPDVMLSAGVGDILGKYVALRDWKLAEREKGEYFCPRIAGMIDTAVGRCAAGMEGIAKRDPAAIKDMADTLVLSGVAISMHGLSRPASGSEHQLAHHWEVELLGVHGRETPLHGNLVGFGTQVACRLYRLAGEEFDLDFPYPLPAPEEIAGCMRIFGGYGEKETLGITRELLYDSFFHATAANGRYTVISFLEEQGRLGRYARLVTDEVFAGG